MSFILDALRKSEHERQRQTGPNIGNPYAAPPRPAFSFSTPWVVGIGALLLINLAVVLLLIVRGGNAETGASPAGATSDVAAATPPADAKIQSTPASHQAGSSPSAAAPSPQAPEAAPTSTTHEPPAVIEAPEEAGSVTPPSNPDVEETLPTIHELTLKGADALPELHLDIHVYSTRPSERFVFINMHKYHEGGRTPEGIAVERITPDGVVLNRSGMRFVLPRQ